MAVQHAPKSGSGGALDRLVNREDVLQICFWRSGEGFGEVCTAQSIQPFLACNAEAIDSALQELVSEGQLEPTVSGEQTGYRLTAKGKKMGGALFADTFAENQRQGHGECPAGCCDGDDHSKCGDDCALH
jgi:hypothetical protein